MGPWSSRDRQIKMRMEALIDLTILHFAINHSIVAPCEYENEHDAMLVLMEKFSRLYVRMIPRPFPCGQNPLPSPKFVGGPLITLDWGWGVPFAWVHEALAHDLGHVAISALFEGKTVIHTKMAEHHHDLFKELDWNF
jgi:hypothetical protein